jgi:hypothetical protein
MKKKPKDRHLETPSEANRDKHINFVALERNEEDPSDVPATGKVANEEDLNEQDLKKDNEQKETRRKKD